MTGLFDILVQVAGLALLAVLMFMTYRRKVQGEYPFFAAYVTYAFAQTLLLLCVTANYKIYFWTYWIGETGSIVVTLLAVHEVFRDVFYGFYLLWWFRLIFPAVVVLVSAISIRYAMLAPAPYAPRIMYVIFAIDNAVSYVQAGVFLVFIVVVAGLRVRWRRYPHGIALGFAISSMGTLLSYALFTHFGITYARMAKYAPPIAFIVGNIVWLWTVWGKAEPRPTPESIQDLPSDPLIDRVRHYIRAMQGEPAPGKKQGASGHHD